MDFIVNTFLPLLLFIGFVAYCLKTYFHFLYLKIIKRYPDNLNFFRFLSFINSHFMDRVEIILPFLWIRNKTYLSESNALKARLLENKIIICIVISIIGFSSIPLGIYLQSTL